MLRYARTKVLPSKPALIIVLLEVWITLSTFLNNGLLGVAWSNKIRTIALMALVIDYLSKDIEMLLRALMLHCELCVYINLATVLVFPQGLYSRIIGPYAASQEWFLGVTNYFIIWLLPAMMIAWIYKEYFKDSKRSVCLIICCIITEIIKGSGTGLVGVFLLLILLLFPFWKKIITPFRGVLIVGVMFVVIVVLNNANFLEPIIVGLLGKDMTFSNRITIWSNAISAILSNPLLGYGIKSNEVTSSILGVFQSGFIWTGATHCHNEILQVAFLGGFVALALYFMIYYLSIRKCVRYWNSRIAQIMMYSLITLIVIGITEVYEYSETYMIMLLPFYLDKFIYNHNIKNKER